MVEGDATIPGVYGKFVRGVTWLVPVVLLLIRLAWGWELAESGWGGLHHLDKRTAFFTELKIPMPRANAVISSTTELVGGVLWMAGLGTRLISVALVFNFAVAMFTASHDNVMHFFSQDPSKLIDDTAFPFFMMALLLVAVGPGCFSIDAIIARVTRRTVVVAT